MSDVWYSDKDEREALTEAEKAGAAIERRGSRWMLYPLVGIGDPGELMWFDDLNALRTEVRARLKRRQAEAPAPPPPQAMQPEQDVFKEEPEEDEAEEEDETPHPQRRSPPPRRRR